MKANDSLAGVQWLVSLGAKFARVVPVRTFWVVILTLLSQVSYILAFFLPLKIVILLGSDGMPRYFPRAFAQLDRDWLVIVLSVATLGFFIVHTIAEKLIDRVTSGAAIALLSRSHKIILFEKQEDVATDAFEVFSRALAGIVFALLAIGFLTIYYPDMAIVITSYLLSLVVSAMVVRKFNAVLFDKLEVNLKECMRLTSATGFFVVFAYLVVDFVWLSPPGLIAAFISIILSRQMFSRLSSAIAGLVKLSMRRLKLDALFFHGKLLLPASQIVTNKFWPLLSPHSRISWVRHVLSEYSKVTNVTDEQLESGLSWLQPAIHGMGMLSFRRGEEVYIIKLYGERSSSLALHEATLLCEPMMGLPAPVWLGATDVGDYRCSIYRVVGGEIAAGRGRFDTTMYELSKRIMLVEPSARLAERYLRSRPTLPHRMSYNWLELLEIAIVDEDQRKALSRLKDCWEEVRQSLFKLPLSYVVPLTSSQSVWFESPSAPLLLHWERWSIEPLGVGWPYEKKRLHKLFETVADCCTQRSELRNVPNEILALSALMGGLERLVQKQDFRSAVNLVPAMVPSLDFIKHGRADGLKSFRI